MDQEVRDPIPGHDALIASVPLFDPSSMPIRGWCAGSREDPVTGLVAFPDFHLAIAPAIAAELRAGRLAALAIGDVDGLKAHVEQANATDPASFGHLAGNKVMARLGGVTRDWFREQPWTAGCAATFGGDEVIIAASVSDPAAFQAAVCDLRDRLAGALPVRASFAVTVAGPGQLPDGPVTDRWKHDFTDKLLAAADRALFSHKEARRASGSAGGIVAVTQAPGGRMDGTLQPLPDPGQELHVTAQTGYLGGRPALLLPCHGPAGLRGRRLRVTFPGTTARTVVAVSAGGQAALPRRKSAGLTEPNVPLVLRGLRGAARQRVPGDLTAALHEERADWDALPAHEQSQMLHLITESADPQVRALRIAAAARAAARPRGRA
jgi:GGDEF domain-containing protein